MRLLCGLSMTAAFRLWAIGSVIGAWIFLVASCSTSRELTRSHALTLIKKAQEIARSVSITIETGQYVQDQRRYYERYEALRSLGFIEIKENPPVKDVFNVDRTVPAAKGVFILPEREQRFKDITMFPGNNRVWRITTAEKVEVTEVTGILKDTEGTVIAEFHWQWVPNEIGEALLKAGMTLNGVKAAEGQINPVNQGAAAFRLYDDGWRLTDLQW